MPELVPTSTTDPDPAHLRTPSFPAVRGESSALLRRCACGQHTGGGECEECRRKRRAGIQAKLEVGSPGDAFEQEADRMAERVMRMPAPAGSHGRHHAREEGRGAGRRGAPAPTSCPALRRCAADARGTVPAVSPGLEASIYDGRGGGAPLSGATRAFFEPRFGRDFSRVRVHADAGAARSAREVEARAFTLGSDIFFNAGRFAPESTEGRSLLAHELTHVAQQGQSEALASPAPPMQRSSELRLRRQAGPASGGMDTRPRVQDVEFEGCQPEVVSSITDAIRPAMSSVDRAIEVLGRGWNNMGPSERDLFGRYFDPAGSGDIDEGFVRDVRSNYGAIRQGLNDLTFSCHPDRHTVCGSSSEYCTGGRLAWTCFGTVYVCPDWEQEPDFRRKVRYLIHETAHNALATTDREYTNSTYFSRLRPRGSGILSILSQIPVLGILFRQFRANNDTLYNPDSYSYFADGLHEPV